MLYFAAKCPANHREDLAQLTEACAEVHCVPYNKNGRAYVITIGKLKEDTCIIRFNLYAVPGGNAYELSQFTYEQLLKEATVL